MDWRQISPLLYLLNSCKNRTHTLVASPVLKFIPTSLTPHTLHTGAILDPNQTGPTTCSLNVHGAGSRVNFCRQQAPSNCARHHSGNLATSLYPSLFLPRYALHLC